MTVSDGVSPPPKGRGRSRFGSLWIRHWYDDRPVHLTFVFDDSYRGRRYDGLWAEFAYSISVGPDANYP